MTATTKKQTDLLEGSIWKGLVTFAMPIFLGNLFQQLYNTADALIVGNFLGKQSLAAVSSSGNLIFMLTGLLTGISLGAGVIIARYFGARDDESLHRAVHTDIAFAVIAGLILTVFGVLFTPTILGWMGTPKDVINESVSYLRVFFLGFVPVFMYNICTGILQAVGDSKHPLYYLIVSSAVNVVLDLILVGVFRLGVAYAALATIISQAVSAALSLRKLYKSDGAVRLVFRDIRIDGQMLGQIIRFGLPSGVQNSVIGFANVIVQSNINVFGPDAMAGCGSYGRIEGFAFLPITCFAMALSTFVSQNLGAKQFDRVKKGSRFGIICAVIIAELIGVVTFIFAPSLIKLFNRDTAVVAFGVRQARVEALFYFVLAFSHCVAGVLRGSGKATVPMLTMLACWCVIRVTYISIAIPIIGEIWVLFSAYPITWSLSSVFFLIYYLKADWMHNFERLDAKRTMT